MSCKTMSIDLANVPPVPIQIGVAGENSFRTITFDASKWGADYPDATYTVVYRRSDGYLYPVLVNASADAIVWSPSETDTDVSGNGQLEVRLLDGETIGKTIIMQTYVAPSLSGDESEPSTPAPDWVNDVVDDADRAEAAATHYPKIVNGVWYVWNAETGEFVSTGISAHGEDGVSPTVTVTEIEGGHRVTITDASDDHTFDVMDGKGSQGGAVESVNGKTGVVVLDASDVGALPDDTVIPPTVTEQTVSGWGFTKNTGTYSKPSGGIPKSDLASAVQTSLGKADTALQSAPVTSVNNKTGAVVLGASDVHALPDSTVIPPTVTEQTVAGWGFTKNTGTYSKPNGGIPDSDIASAATWNAKGTYSKPSGGIPASDLAAGVIPDVSGKANAADVYTKTEVDQKLVGAMDYKGTKATVSELPTSGNNTGDVWHVDADGSEWAWNGSTWEELGAAVDLSGYRTASAQDEIDAAQDAAIAAKYTKPSTGIPKTDLASDVKASLGKADTALQTAPVTSVNNKTGAVTLTASDVGALPSSTSIPTKVSDLTNDSNFQTAAQVQTAIAGVRQLPTVSASDNGKFLRVVSGAWAAQAVPAAESASFGGA